jgi:hypothetical protein
VPSASAPYALAKPIFPGTSCVATFT